MLMTSIVIGFILTIGMSVIIGKIIIEQKPFTKQFDATMFILWIVSLAIWSILSSEWLKVYSWAFLIVFGYGVIANAVSPVPFKVWIKHIWKKS